MSPDRLNVRTSRAIDGPQRGDPTTLLQRFMFGYHDFARAARRRNRIAGPWGRPVVAIVAPTDGATMATAAACGLESAPGRSGPVRSARNMKGRLP